MSLMKIMIIATFVFVTCSSLEKASNMRLNSSAVGPHAMKHVYTVCIYMRIIIEQNSVYLIAVCMESLFLLKEKG